LAFAEAVLLLSTSAVHSVLDPGTTLQFTILRHIISHLVITPHLSNNIQTIKAIKIKILVFAVGQGLLVSKNCFTFMLCGLIRTNVHPYLPPLSLSSSPSYLIRYHGYFLFISMQLCHTNPQHNHTTTQHGSRKNEMTRWIHDNNWQPEFTVSCSSPLHLQPFPTPLPPQDFALSTASCVCTSRSRTRCACRRTGSQDL
jgi:hypothetical protein